MCGVLVRYMYRTLVGGLLFGVLQLTGTQSKGAQEQGQPHQQRQHENTKSTQYRDLQPTSAPNASNKCDQRPRYVSLHRGPQPLVTPDGPQPLPGGWLAFLVRVCL